MGNLNLEQMITFLLDTPIFEDLDANELSQIVHIMQVRTLPAGSFVFREREVGDAWYVVYSGEVEVLKMSKQNREGYRVTILGPKNCFGEMAILDGSPRSASVRALVDTTAFRFPHEGFNELLFAGTLAAYKLVHQIALVLVSRQRRTTRRLVELMAEDDPMIVKRALPPLIDCLAVAE